MKSTIAWGLRVSIIIYAVLHFITYFYKNEILLVCQSVSGMGLFLFATLIFSIKQFKLPFSLFLIGAIILFVSDASFMDGFINGFSQMRNIIGLLIIVPFISWVLREEPYMEAILHVGHHLLDTSRKFYFSVISFTQIVSYFLIFGAIPMMYHFINMILKNEKGEAWENFKGTALLRGFSLSVLWVVSIPSFVFVVETMEASLWVSIFQGLGVSTFGIIVALIFSHFEEKRYGIDLTSHLRSEINEVLEYDMTKQDSKRKVIEFVFLFISLFGSIFLLHGIFGVELMIIIPLVVLGWTCIYYLVKKRPKKLLGEMKQHVDDDMIKQSYQLSILFGAGMLIFSLNQTNFAETVINGINHLQTIVPFINILYLLPFMVIILGFFGLGPLTVMVLIGGILGSLDLPYAPELIVLTITSGSAISILLSPLIMPLIVLSGANGLNGFKNGIQFNLKYAIAIYIMVQIYVQMMIHVS